jgi:hypothetical protein
MKRYAGLFCIVILILSSQCGKKNNNPASINETTNTGTDSSVVVASCDSLFAVLSTRVHSMDTISAYNGFASMDFISLRSGFNSFIKKYPNYCKANLGYMISALLSLNYSTSVAKLVDSIDGYITAENNYLNSHAAAPEKLMATAYRKEGIIGLGKALAAKTNNIVQMHTLKPSFPGFITLEYIQKIADNEVIPVLDSVVLAANRLEAIDGMLVYVNITDNGQTDTFNVKKGEIYVIESMCHLVRAFLGMFCTYNIDLYAINATNYSWIDTLLKNSQSGSFDSLIYSVSGDTLYERNKTIDTGKIASNIYEAKMLKYNLERSGFLTIRKQYHAKVKADLLAVASCIDSGLTFVRNQNSSDENDIIKISSLTSADESLADLKTQMVDDGISSELASKFSSPENIAGFIVQLLSGPYTFNETVDGNTIDLKVNLSSWFDNPVSDLRTLLPKYTWAGDSGWKIVENKNYEYSTSNSDTLSFTVDSSNSMVSIPDLLIAGKKINSSGYTTYTLTTPIHYTTHVDINYEVNSLQLLDENNNALTDAQIDTLRNNKSFFPCFTDYTFDGVLPDMTTRQKWLNIIYQ